MREGRCDINFSEVRSIFPTRILIKMVTFKIFKGTLYQKIHIYRTNMTAYGSYLYKSVPLEFFVHSEAAEENKNIELMTDPFILSINLQTLIWFFASSLTYILHKSEFRLYLPLPLSRLIKQTTNLRYLKGPSCSKLTMSLVNDSLKLISSDTHIC